MPSLESISPEPEAPTAAECLWGLSAVIRLRRRFGLGRCFYFGAKLGPSPLVTIDEPISVLSLRRFAREAAQHVEHVVVEAGRVSIESPA